MIILFSYCLTCCGKPCAVALEKSLLTRAQDSLPPKQLSPQFNRLTNDPRGRQAWRVGTYGRQSFMTAGKDWVWAVGNLA